MPESPTTRVQLRHEFAIVAPSNEPISTAVIAHNNGHLWLTDVWTAPEHRQKGYARQVLGRVIDEFGDRAIYLHVQPYTDQPLDESSLIAFYSSFGFGSTDVPGIMIRPGGTR